MSTDLILKYVLLAAFVLLGVFYFMKRKDSSSADSETETSETPTQQEEYQTAAEPETTDDLVIIAVITAALAAHLGKELSGLRVSSIHRVVHLESGWAAIARQETIASRQSMYNL